MFNLHFRILSTKCSRTLLLYPLLSAILLLGCQEQIQSGLSETDANEIVAVLSEEGIKAGKKKGDDKAWIVSVEKDEFSSAVRALRARGMPKEPLVGLGEVFKKQGLISTPTEERARLTFALQNELSRSINLIDGVVAARVHVVMPKQDHFTEKAKPSSVSVFVKHAPETSLARLTPQIQRFIATSIEGVNYDNISVSMFTAAPPPVSAEDLKQVSFARSTNAIQSVRSRDRDGFPVTGYVFVALLASGLLLLGWSVSHLGLVEKLAAAWRAKRTPAPRMAATGEAPIEAGALYVAPVSLEGLSASSSAQNAPNATSAQSTEK
jgi:type III secretion protein J